ncbi:hypothetical protein MHU86_16727 [Fragilaria crotonensis]|nr:hypothetical protein MHU86_16727 [Fragilaria crotonensis]
MQLEAGIPQPLLEFPGLKISYLTPTWISSLRQFLSNHNLTMSVSDALRLEKQGTHDEFVMQPSRLVQYTGSQQRDINLVRIYLQCTTISEMRDVQDPRSIAKEALAGVRHSNFAPKPGWPRQEEPTSTQRRLWKRYLSSQFLRYGLLWKRVPSDSLREVKARLKSPTVPLEGSRDLALADMITHLPQGQRRLLTHISQLVDDSAVWNASRSKGKLTIASDGGLKDIRGTFGWTISTSDNTVLFEGAGPVDGPRDVAKNSTRCEIAGFAAPMLLLTLFVRHWGLKYKCKFRWVCDSKAALANVTKHTKVHEPCRRQPENADFLSQIRCLKRESGKSRPILTIFEIAKTTTIGHTSFSQDKKKLNLNLTCCRVAH